MHFFESFFNMYIDVCQKQTFISNIITIILCYAFRTVANI